jgi:hypothetical protein
LHPNIVHARSAGLILPKMYYIKQLLLPKFIACWSKPIASAKSDCLEEGGGAGGERLFAESQAAIRTQPTTAPKPAKKKRKPRTQRKVVPQKQ